MVASTYLPVTGGLFLGDEARECLEQKRGRFWILRNQRNTARTRFRYLFTPRLWAAIERSMEADLPVAFQGTIEQAGRHNMVRRLSTR